jgi:hypothetical protein
MVTISYYFRWSSGFSFRKLITFVIIGCVIYWALKCCCFGPRTMHGASTYSSYTGETQTIRYLTCGFLEFISSNVPAPPLVRHLQC